MAIVGARNGSAAGMKLTRLFAARLGEAGFVVVSGLARGIDGAAHEASLATGTIAVLAGGIDFVYPPEHADLQAADRSRRLSRQRDGRRVFSRAGRTFPRRNRIISGVALGVVVIEAARRSGSLITARTAAEQGRLVMAVPGHPLDPSAEGTNGLIKHGATHGHVSGGVLEALRTQMRAPSAVGAGDARGRRRENSCPPSRPLPAYADAIYLLRRARKLRQLEEAHDRVLAVLGPAPIEIDEVARATGLGIRTTRSRAARALPRGPD